MAPSKRPATAVKQETVNHAIVFLQELPEKPKEELSLREAVDQMKDLLRAALNRGYSYDDLAKMLTDKGMKISALTLKNYVPSGKRQAAAKTTTRRSKKQSSDADASAPVSPAAVPASLDAIANAITVSPSNGSNAKADPVEAAPTPPKARRGRTKAAAKETTETTSRTKATRGRKPAASKQDAPPSPPARRGRRPKSAE